MTKFVWVNGEYIDENKPVIKASDQGYHFGYGIFEDIRIYPNDKGFGRPFELEEHIRRLTNSAKKLKIPLTISYRSFKSAIERLIKLNDQSSAHLRITLSNGEDEDNSNCMIELLPLEDSAEKQLNGVKISISPYRRSIESPLYQHRTLNYMENIMLQSVAKQKDIFEFIFLNTRDEVSEGTMTNVFIVRRGRVLTPHLSSNILPGITRKVIFGLCTGNGIRIREKVLREDDLLSADEVFLTNSIIEIIPAVECDDESIGLGKVGLITQLLQNSYRQLVESTL